MAGEITVVSNLTHAAGGSTVTGATTSDVIDDNSLNKRHSLIVQDVVSTATEVADVGDVDTSKEYFVRLRNLETANPVLVFVTSSGTDVEIGRMKFGGNVGAGAYEGCRVEQPAPKSPGRQCHLPSRGYRLSG
jgi:hypothetical protein